MNAWGEFFHYITIALMVSVNAIAVGIGEGFASLAAIDASHKQPGARADILRTNILGSALIETSAIFGLLVAIILLLFSPEEGQTLIIGISELGICAAICFSGAVLGIVSGFPTRAACYAIARQPFIAQKITGFMIMTQALIQTPIISALLVAIFIKGQSTSITTISDSLRLLASGLCVGLGSIGPGIGLALFAQTAIAGIGINKKAYNKLLSFTLLSEVIIETPVIFCMVISIMLLFVVPQFATENYVKGICYIAAAICTGLGTIGPGIASGKSASAACTQIAYHPEKYSNLSRISLISQGLIETVVIYSVLVSVGLLFFT